MKKLIFIAVALTLMVGMIWAPSVAAVTADITIHKTIGAGCPEEVFHFEAWRDLDNDGIIDDPGDILVGTVDITGAGTGVITANLYGKFIIREVLMAGSAYDQQPDKIVVLACDVHVYFHNTCFPQECGLVIRKIDAAGVLLGGACFELDPDPRTGTGVMTLCDNDPNLDECPEDGVLCLSGLICGLVVRVEETVPPPGGYRPGPPQTVTIADTPELTFVNRREGCVWTCTTVCAAQTAPGEFLFDPGQVMRSTWIYYDIGWGAEDDPYEYPIYTGKDELCGTLYVYDDGTHIFVNYVLTDMGCIPSGRSYYLQVDSSLADLEQNVMIGKNPVPLRCEYMGSFAMVAETGYIEAVDDDISNWTTAYIFASGIGCFYCP